MVCGVGFSGKRMAVSGLRKISVVNLLFVFPHGVEGFQSPSARAFS
jgi:hypothetical protein